ncbi:hypothetical protein RYX36_031869, partial [Vicia faba]
RDRKSNKPLIKNSRNKKAVEIEATTTVQFRRLQSENDSSHGDDSTRLAGLAFMFSASILLQILACAIYNNWWPMLSALMYVLVPMPCLFFGGGSTHFMMSREGGG